MSNSQKNSIFRLYSNNLSKYSNLVDSYVCPICQNVFKIKDISKLTVEHSIPKKLGGSQVILTCKTCNNDFGSKYISKFVEKLNFLDIGKGLIKKPYKSKVTIKDIQLNTEFSPDDKVWTFVVPENINDPKSKGKITTYFEQGKIGEVKANISLGPSDKFFRLSLLLSSHLLIFSQFGYFYLFNSSGQLIRDLIINSRDDHYLCNNFDFSENEDIKSIIDENINLLGCNFPANLKGYVTTLIPLHTEYSYYIYGLILPVLPGIKTDASTHQIGNNINFNGIKIPYDENFLNIEFQLPNGKVIFN